MAVNRNRYTVRAGVSTTDYLPAHTERVNRRTVFETVPNPWDDWYILNRWPSVCSQCARDASYFYLKQNDLNPHIHTTKTKTKTNNR